MSVAPRQAVILAGGSGSRLGALTAETPKPLLHVGGRPFVEWLLGKLELEGVEEVIFTTGYRAGVFQAWLDAWRGPPSASAFVEEEPLDTGGALTLLVDRLDEAFYVLNGDTLFDAPLLEMAALWADSPGSAVVALRSVSDTGRYGRITLDGPRVTSFAEKAEAGSGLINGGVYLLTRASLVGRGAPLSIERELMPDLVSTGRLLGLPSDGFFIDIGVPETFEEAQESVPSWWERTKGA